MSTCLSDRVGRPLEWYKISVSVCSVYMNKVQPDRNKVKVSLVLVLKTTKDLSVNGLNFGDIMDGICLTSAPLWINQLCLWLWCHMSHQILSFKICCLWGGLSPSDHWVVLFTCQWWPSGCWFSSWCLEQTEVPRLFQWSRWEPGSAPEESSHLLVHLVKRRNEAPPLCRPSAPGSAPEEPQCHLGYVGTWHLALIVGHNKPF